MVFYNLCIFILLSLFVLVIPSQYHNIPGEDEQPRPLNFFFQRTRSMNGGYATDGDPTINDEVYRVFMLTILHGFNIFKIKMYNDRAFIDVTRRNYWLGDRYYYMDNRYYLPTRDSCAYRMNETERQHLFYEEDNRPIFDIIYQCLRYEEYCCGLNCCRTEDIGKREEPRKPPKYPWQDPWHHNVASLPHQFLLTSILISFSIFILYE